VSDVFAPWQQRAHDQTVAALDAGRLGHGLLLCGPAGMGKRAVAMALARHVLDTGMDAAGRTRNAQLIAAGTHPDLQVVSFIPNKTGDKLRTEIVIEQVREISQKLALTPQYGAAQVVIVDPADAINRAACNALLKTLEEPAPGRYLWLVSADPARLPQTIRSRCQRLEFRLPAREEALAWLQRQGHAEGAAREALDAARGHPGLADRWLQARRRTRRRGGAGPALERRRACRPAPAACRRPGPAPGHRRLDRSGPIAQAGRLVRCRQPHPRPAAHHGARRSGDGGAAAGLGRGQPAAIQRKQSMSATNARQGILSLAVKDKAALYSAYMPFVKNGGVFVPTPKRYFVGDEVFVLLTLPDSSERLPVAGKVVWVTPLGAQGNRQAGIGVQLADGADGEAIRGRIETLLAGTAGSDKPTHTM